MPMRLFTLDEQGRPVEEPDAETWRQWFHAWDDQKIAETILGDVVVTTVFYPVTHDDADPPPLWETAIFGGEKSGSAERCTGARADALRMHEEAVNKVKKLQDSTSNNNNKLKE